MCLRAKIDTFSKLGTRRTLFTSFAHALKSHFSSRYWNDAITYKKSSNFGKLDLGCEKYLA